MYRDAADVRASQAEAFLRSLALRAGVGALLVVLVLLICRGGVVRRYEERILDRRIVMWRQLSEANTSRITLVAIDEDSLKELHSQWPLPRGIYARAIDRLRRSGAEAIGVTIVFEGAGADPLQDQALTAVLGDEVVLASRLDLHRDPATVQVPPFKCASGFCEVPLDADGVARQFYISPSGVEPPPICMPLALLRAAYHNMQFIPRGFVDDPGTLYPIAWAGTPEHTFHTIALKKVLSGADISKDVKSTIVLLGSTLPGPANNIRTPFARRSANPPDPPMSTVELTANVLFSLLGTDSLQPLSRAEYLVLVGGLVFTCFMLFASLHPLLSMVCTGFLMALYGVGAMHAMIMSQRLLPLVAPLTALGLTWVAAVVYRISFKAWRKRTTPP